MPWAAAQKQQQGVSVSFDLRDLYERSAVLNSPYDSLCRALSHRSEAAQRCTADVQQRLTGRMQHILEDELCPRLPPHVAGLASGVDSVSSRAEDNAPLGSSGGTAFCEANASLALAVFMADLVAQAWTVTSFTLV
jgi:hypothetical protein